MCSYITVLRRYLGYWQRRQINIEQNAQKRDIEGKECYKSYINTNNYLGYT